MLLNNSARIYDLRTRTRAGVATRTGQTADDTLVNVGNQSDEVAPPYAETSVPDTETRSAVRMYSDVVALRPPSPIRERPVVPLVGPATGPDHARVVAPEPSNDGSYGGRGSDNEGSVEVETPDQPEYHSWKNVQRKRACSDSALHNKGTLTLEQREAVKLAAKGLTKEQQQKLLQQQEKVQPRRDSSMSSRGEGTSKLKGKNVDPREWGNIDFSRENLDIDAQMAALKSYKAQLKARKRSQKKENRRRKRSQSVHREDEQGKKSKKSKHSKRPAESQPVAQIAPKSYLGAALKNIGRSRNPRTPTEPSSSSDESSSDSPSSESSISSSDDESTSSSDKDSGDSDSQDSDQGH
jgi:hypothetical protein